MLDACARMNASVLLEGKITGEFWELGEGGVYIFFCTWWWMRPADDCIFLLYFVAECAYCEWLWFLFAGVGAVCLRMVVFSFVLCSGVRLLRMVEVSFKRMMGLCVLCLRMVVFSFRG